MALNYGKVDIRGKYVVDVFTDLLFEIPTLNKGYVSFVDDVKASTIFTEARSTASIQAYASGVPSTQGALNVFDYEVIPTKYMYYQTYNPDTLRFTRFNVDMSQGAINVLSNEFTRKVIFGKYGLDMANNTEKLFWNSITQATKTAILAGSYTDEEKALVNELTVSLFDGVIAKILRNDINSTKTLGKGTYTSVSHDEFPSATNIKVIFDKLYGSVKAELIANSDKVAIAAPNSWRAFINIYNNNPANFNKAFEKRDGEFYYNDFKINFINLDSDNAAFVYVVDDVAWVTDMISDVNQIKEDAVPGAVNDRFLLTVGTISAHLSNQEQIVLISCDEA